MVHVGPAASLHMCSGPVLGRRSEGIKRCTRATLWATHRWSHSAKITCTDAADTVGGVDQVDQPLRMGWADEGI